MFRLLKERQLRELGRMQERTAMLHFYRWASWGMMLQQRGQLVVRVVVARAPGALLRTGGRAATGAVMSGPAAPVVGTIVLLGGAAYEIIGISAAISEAANQQEQQASEALGVEGNSAAATGGASPPPEEDNDDGNQSRGKSVNQINSDVRRNKAPEGIKRADTGKVKGEQDHVHLNNGNALNRDGTWKHVKSEQALTRAQEKYLMDAGWKLPK
jgi:hypothetical protein